MNSVPSIVIDNTSKGVVVKVTRSKMTINSSREIFATPDAYPMDVAKGYRGCVPWGKDNKLPFNICDKVDKSEVLSSSLLFNVLAAYGAGIMTCYIEYDSSGKKKIIPVEDENVNTFFEENDINYFLLEQFYDLLYFGSAFPEIIASNDSKSITNIYSKEAVFSRWEAMNPDTGIIENHFYNNWADSPQGEPLVTPVLNKYKKLEDLRERLSKRNDKRFIVPLNFPSPGRLYYPKTPWHSVFKSGWYDISVSIPEFKKHAMLNQMSVKYQIEFENNYFMRIFSEEGITDAEEQKKRKKQEVESITSCLTGTDNAKKTIISYFRTVGDKEISNVKIKAIGADDKGGEYLDDTEEASNIMNNAMQVHPNIVGSAPGKNATINGTEARELFIIKQAMMQPYRDLVLYPFNLIKAINGWDKKLKFVIPNLELTTLDKGTGAQKGVGTPAIS